MKRATLEKMVFILPMLTHIIPIWIKDNLILIQSWIMIWLRCLRLCGIQNKIVNMDWNFIIAHVPIQKICFALIILILVNIYFFFLHDLLTRIYTNVYHMFTYEQSWSYQTKKKCTFWFHWNYYPCEHWIFNNIILKMMLFLACFEFYRDISSTTSSLFLISIESLRSCIAH